MANTSRSYSRGNSSKGKLKLTPFSKLLLMGGVAGAAYWYLIRPSFAAGAGMATVPAGTPSTSSVPSQPQAKTPTGSTIRNDGAFVRWFQAALNNFAQQTVNPVDGVYANNKQVGASQNATAVAVRAFQVKNGLDVDGVVGPKTAAKMVALGAGTIPPVGR